MTKPGSTFIFWPSPSHIGQAPNGELNEKSLGVGSSYEILQLKSANFLGKKVLNESSDMHFAGSDHVMKVSNPNASAPQKNTPAEYTKTAKASFLRFFSLNK